MSKSWCCLFGVDNKPDSAFCLLGVIDRPDSESALSELFRLVGVVLPDPDGLLLAAVKKFSSRKE